MTSDVIEQEIFIQADIGRVWALVAKTGFWVGDDLHLASEAKAGETVVIDTPRYGRFPVQVERLDPPRYAAYRWASGAPGAAPTEPSSTLVEFTLVERDGGVLPRLKESGFARVAGGQAFRDDNLAGWTMQLARLRQVAAGGVPAR